MSQRWIQKYINEAEIGEISQAVQRAEESTLGDIVPMIVRRSSAVRHVPVVLTLSFSLLFFGFELLGLNGWYLSDLIPVIQQHWGLQIGFLLLLFVLAWWLAHLHPVQRFLTSDADERDQVEKRAQLEFFLQRLHRTHRHSAVLIFVSVMERRAVILADEGLAKKLPPNVWNDVLAPLSEHLHRGHWNKGFQDAILRSGELLKTHFPAKNGESAGELSNQLIIKE
jgi:putative membrane protein